MDDSNNNISKSSQQKPKPPKKGLMSPAPGKVRSQNPMQLTVDSASRVGSSQGTKPPVSKRRGSNKKVEPPAIISS
jgi:hypothetical protein